MASQAEEIREIRQDLDDIKTLLAAEVAENGHESRIRINREDLREWAHDAGTNLRSAYDRSRYKAAEAGTRYRVAVKEHPVSSTAMAFFGGWLLSRLLNRRTY